MYHFTCSVIRFEFVELYTLDSLEMSDDTELKLNVLFDVKELDELELLKLHKLLLLEVDVGLFILIRTKLFIPILSC